MDYVDEVFLNDLSVCWVNFTITLKVDACFAREVILPSVEDCLQRKDVVSYDVVFYDKVGTRMLARMSNTNMVNRFLWMMVRGAMLEISGLSVHRGGEGVHKAFHLHFRPETAAVHCFDVFPTMKLPLFSNQHVSWRLAPAPAFFDLAGFVSSCSEVSPRELDGYYDQQFSLVMHSYNKASSTWSEDRVKCFIRGSWVERVQRDVADALDGTDVAFVLIRYVIMHEAEYEHCRCVKSVSNATTLDVDPPIIQVQRLKRELIASFN